MADLKHCTKCDTTKPVSEFSRDRSKRDGLYAHCKLCKRAAHDKWHAANREQILDRKRQYDAANRDRNREYNAARQAADPMWTRLIVGAHRARKLGNPVEKFTSADLQAYWQSIGIDPTRCFYTGELLGDDFHLDHMTPLSRGGAHVVDNIVPCSPAANLAKQAQTADEYMNREAVAA